MKLKILMAFTGLWFAFWILMGFLSTPDGLTLVLTLVFPSFCLGYVIACEQHKEEENE